MIFLRINLLNVVNLRSTKVNRDDAFFVQSKIFHVIMMPWVADTDIIFFVLFLLSFFFSSSNLSGRRLDVYHTAKMWCGLSGNLECRSEMYSMRLP